MAKHINDVKINKSTFAVISTFNKIYSLTFFDKNIKASMCFVKVYN